MTRLKRRRSDRSGRAPLPSPGRPPVAGRDELRRFWAAIALGLSSEDAAAGANVPQAVGARWFRKAGGMPPAMFGTSARPLSGRYLSFAEREEIATSALLDECDPRKLRSSGRALGAPGLFFLNSGTVAEASKVVKPAASKHATILILDRV